MPITYSSYLRLDELLDLQTPASDPAEHDETLFIVVHQVYELWFKQILHEIDRLEQLLLEGRGPGAQHTLQRVLTILKVLVAQVDVLETMTPLEFLTFRDRLEAGSGFQSYQFRALEFALGLKDPRALTRVEEGSPSWQLLRNRLDRPTVWDAFLRYLALQGCFVPEAELHRDVTRPIAPSPELQRVLIDVYRNDPTLSALCERLVDLDEGMQEWRYRHVKMVERTIGAKMGTGGSSGAEYLRSTLFRAVFPDLWEIRSEL